jgi:hypothetical protein
MKCSIDSCDRKSHAKSFCTMHYDRFRLYGDALMSRVITNPRIDVVEKASMHTDDTCFIWPFGSNSKKYPTIKMYGKSQLVTRIICERTNGAPPTPKHEAAHSCGKGALGCISPRHLRWATRTENEGDKVIHGTVIRGMKSYRSKLTDTDILEIRKLVNFLSQTEIGKMFNVGRGTISKIILRKRWTHITDDPSFYSGVRRGSSNLSTVHEGKGSKRQ